MSGHSKWHNIQERKGKVDANRAKAFTQLSRIITLAVKKGGPDASYNFALRLAIDRAREASVPKDNIDRAIKRGTGELAGAEIVQNRYEGYGPGGVAMMVDTLTDNPNRTVADLKHAFSKNGGNLAGSVAWQFEQKGVLAVTGHADKAKNDDWLLELLEAGGEDAQANGENLVVLTPTTKVGVVKDWLEKAGMTVTSSELHTFPKERMAVTDPAVKEQLQTLIDAVEAMDDVEGVSHNAEI